MFIDMNNIQKLGLASMTGVGGVFFLEKIGGSAMSTLAGKIYCGEKYLQKVDGVISDLSCGFNSDIHLITFLSLSLTFGLMILVAGSMKERL
jgi:hypothetical protein